MPFTYPGSLVSRVGQFFNKRILAAVEAGGNIVFKAIFMTILSRQYHCAAWPADRIGNIGTFEYHTFVCNTIDPGSSGELWSVSTDRLVSMIIRYNEYNVWTI